jgi:Kdo2-lipid IVA lauroyltransferase/acyltransferase
MLPFRLLYALSDGVFILVYHVFGYRRSVVKENLDLVFPDKSDQEIKSITKAFYHHLCDMMLESIKSLTISEREMKKHFTFSNVELLQNIENDGKSIALMCAHYGSWEWIFILQSYLKNKGYAVYKRLKNKYFNRLIKRIRAKHNSYLITTKETFPVLIESKANGNLTICGFVSDQNIKLEKAMYWQEFMGIKVPVIIGTEILAKKLDMSVVFFKVKRLKRGYYETTFETITLNPNELENYKITDAFLKLVEKQIYEAPEYYLWTHRRWKHRNNVPKEFQ